MPMWVRWSRSRCARPTATASSTAVATVPHEHRNNRATCSQGNARAHVASVTSSACVICCFPRTQGIDSTCTPAHRGHPTRRGA